MHALRTTARMTALSPGLSPPPVSTPTRIVATLSDDSWDRGRWCQTVAMAWDSARPVPWKRLLVPFAVYAAVATLAFTIFGQSKSLIGILGGVSMGGLLYLGVAIILVKFGWNPPQWGSTQPRQKAESGSTSATRSSRASGTSTDVRAKPKPTTRTNAGNHRVKRSR